MVTPEPPAADDTNIMEIVEICNESRLFFFSLLFLNSYKLFEAEVDKYTLYESFSIRFNDQSRCSMAWTQMANKYNSRLCDLDLDP
jgi:hypothetical protein